MKKLPYGKCRLCNQHTELVRSHIVPEFLFTNIYDKEPKGYFDFQVNMADVTKSSVRREQMGIRENLMCRSCESLLSDYENYASKTLYSMGKNLTIQLSQPVIRMENNSQIISLVGFDYKKLKIFLMSLFWRLLESKNFTEISADATIREKLRSAIFNETPLKFDEFGCIIGFALDEKGQLASKFIFNSFLIENPESLVLNQLIDGVMHSFFYTSEKCDAEVKKLMLQENGQLIIVAEPLINNAYIMNGMKQTFEHFQTLKRKKGED